MEGNTDNNVKKVNKKKIITALLAATVCISLCACSNSTSTADNYEKEDAEQAWQSDTDQENFSDDTDQEDSSESFEENLSDESSEEEPSEESDSSYTLDDISGYDGCFRYNPSSGEVVPLSDNYMHDRVIRWVSGHENTSSSNNTYLWWPQYDEEPVSFNREDGDTFILTGDAMSHEVKQHDDVWKVKKVEFIGYGNPDMIGNLGLEMTEDEDGNSDDEIEDISGKDISVLKYESPLEGSTIVTSIIVSQTKDEPCKISYYDGTQYEEVSIALCFPYFYDFRNDADTIDLPVERTKDGYFTVDISSLEPGIYATDSYDYFFQVEK